VAHERDELFTPSLTQTRRRILVEGERPWRLGSQFYVAFFGGPVGAATVGWLNGGRLQLPQARRVAIAAAGLAAFALAAVLVRAVDSEWASPRFLLAATGVLAYAVSRWLQHAADRRYGIGQEDTYDSLWGPGLAIVLVCGFASAAVLMVLE
jgi:hypothetical protein